MPGLRDARWRAVASLSTVSVGLATLATLTSTLAADHVWALVVAVIAAAAIRAVCAGGVTSILSLAGTMVVGQPALHMLGDVAHGEHEVVAAHSVVACVFVLALHAALFVILTALAAACDTAGRALVARFRRLVRIVVRTVGAGWHVAVRPRVESPTRRPKERLRARLPGRRGPPAALFALAV